MFGKHADVHTLITDEIQDVKATLWKFESFMSAASIPDAKFDTLALLCEGVCKCEADADLALRKMIDSLATAYYLPATKKEIIDVAGECDRIANKCEHTAKMLVVQKCRIPTEYTDGIKNILATTLEQFELLETAISRMFSDFKSILKDHSILDEIRSKESVVDKIEEKIYEDIFNSDEELARKMQLSRMIELVCDISDIIENIADKLQVMLITRKA
jgi:predicted phosphate transport protein (TIGR00153 family)